MWCGARWSCCGPKPVVVSMGSYAASGGYYIACPGRCDPRRPHDPHGLDRRVRHVPQYGGCAEKQARHHARRREDQRFGGHGGHGGRSRPRSALRSCAAWTAYTPRSRSMWPGAQPPAGACARHRAGACGRGPMPRESVWSMRTADCARRSPWRRDKADLGADFRVVGGA